MISSTGNASQGCVRKRNINNKNKPTLKTQQYVLSERAIRMWLRNQVPWSSCTWAGCDAGVVSEDIGPAVHKLQSWCMHVDITHQVWCLCADHWPSAHSDLPYLSHIRSAGYSKTTEPQNAWKLFRNSLLKQTAASRFIIQKRWGWQTLIQVPKSLCKWPEDGPVLKRNKN